jgi:beta-xylosidase
MNWVRSLTMLCALIGSTALAFAQDEKPKEKPKHGDVPAMTFPDGVPPPVIGDKFTADPHAVVIGDMYYIYPTVDRENWATTEFNVWSSKDLIHWKDEGVILDLAGKATGKQDVSWAKIRAWAPGVIARDGKVYDYFCGDTNIGVAVADGPTGPFKDAIDKPLVAKGAFKGQMIDPAPFLDDVPAPGAPAGSELQAYLYFGNGNLYVAKLNKDMISLDGEVTRMPVSGNGAAFREGIFVFKRKGIYYFMWSEDDARSENYRVAYGTSDSPLGPIKVAKDRKILQKSGAVVGTGHHSVINVPGTDDWYIVYHRHAVPGGNGFIRETCLGKMEFNSDPEGGPDLIKPVDVNHPAFPEGSKGAPIGEKR